MDLRIYYQKIREAEERMGGEHVVMVSHETADGGKAGVLAEVPKRLAAKLTVDGRARLATTQETQQFRKRQEQAKQAAEELAAAGRVQLALVPTSELEQLRNKAKEKN